MRTKIESGTLYILGATLLNIITPVLVVFFILKVVPSLNLKYIYIEKIYTFYLFVKNITYNNNI